MVHVRLICVSGGYGQLGEATRRSACQPERAMEADDPRECLGWNPPQRFDQLLHTTAMDVHYDSTSGVFSGCLATPLEHLRRPTGKTPTSHPQLPPVSGAVVSGGATG